jgi:2'-5' RNA ligase
MATKKKRVFVGFPISETLQKQILLWEKENLKNIKARFIAGKNLHITLVPPWYERNIKNQILKLKNIRTKIKPFKIIFTKVSFGPTGKSPRLIWAEGEIPKELLKLKLLLEKTFKKKPEKRKFLLHLTIARFKTKDFKNFEFKKLNKKVSWKSRVEAVTLFESHLSSAGADYQILSKVKI